jgi:hypothetical protein
VMGFDYWLVIGCSLLFGPIALVEAIAYVRRGIYTKTFKGTRRREYIHKNMQPVEYWFSVIFHFAMSFAMIGLGLWFLDYIPFFHDFYSEMRAMFPF